MPISHQTLYDALYNAFPEAQIDIEDLRGDNDHYAVTIVSPSFIDTSRIEQHRMVQDAVKDHDIHALAIKTTIPK